MKPVLAALILAAGLHFSGVLSVKYDGGSGQVSIKTFAKEVPVVNLPRSLRLWNYKGGSCVHASNEMACNWQNAVELAQWWRKTYSGGESYNGLVSKLQQAKVPYYSTSQGDERILERCTRERRGAVIFYYPNHSILFCGFIGNNAYVLDNNRIESFIEIPRETFIRNWRSYGGVAIVPVVGSPAPPIPWIAAN